MLLTKVFNTIDLYIVALAILGQRHVIEQRAQDKWPSLCLNASRCASGAGSFSFLVLGVESHGRDCRVTANLPPAL